MQHKVLEIKNKLIDNAIRYGFIFLLPLLFSSIFRYVYDGWLTAFSIQIVIAVLFTILFVVHRKLPLQMKVAIYALLYTSVGLVNLIYFNGKSGIAFLVLIVMIVAITSNKQTIIFYSTIISILIIVIGILMLTNSMKIELHNTSNTHTFMNWFSSLIIFLYIIILVINTISLYNNFFIENIHQLNDKIAEYEDTQQSLKAAEIALEKQNAELRLLNLEYLRAKQLAESNEEELKLLIYNIPSAIIVFNSDVSIMHVNPLASEMMGLSSEFLNGKFATDTDWAFVTETGMPMKIEQYPVNRVKQTGKPVIGVLMGIRRNVSPRLLWVIVNAVPVFNKSGSLMRILLSFTDISKIKQMEVELKAAHDKIEKSTIQLRQISDNLTDGMVFQYITNELNTTRKFTYISAGVEKLHKHSQDAVIENPDLFFKQIHLDDVYLFARAEVEAMIDKSPLRVELRMVMPDGRMRWRLITAIPTQIADNKIAWDGMELDITERKKTEVALIESEALQNSIFNSTADLIWSVDSKELKLTSFNKALFNYFKVAGIHVSLGMKVSELLGEKYMEIWLEFYRRVLKEGAFSVEYQASMGGRILLLHFNLLYKQNTVFGISVFAKDITIQKNYEKSLVENEMRYRSLIEGMMDAYVKTDLAGNILEYNEAYKHLTGYTNEELKRLTYKDLTPEKWHNLEAKIIREESMVYGHSNLYEKEYRRKDGTIVPVELRTNLKR